ncbi:MAG: hypothetical protein U0990_00405 [Candidatus Nanopelagicales bacterium]|nr:hypothetical protein [Candidatus Nanopelagicales bacterium]MDZ4248535.1 hypothetical protein [Candidatus Nanopelagicales bacterium]
MSQSHQLFMVDTSLYAGVRRSPAIRAVVEAFNNAWQPATCVPLALELLHTTQTYRQFQRVTALVSSMENLGSDGVDQLARQLQLGLWRSHRARAAGPVDILVSAYAIAHDAVILHHDYDYGHVHKVDSRLGQLYIHDDGRLEGSHGAA